MPFIASLRATTPARVVALLLISVACAAPFAPQPVRAQTLTEALAAAYDTNPELNLARANLRAVDENIAIARSGNRPNLTATFEALNTTTRTVGDPPSTITDPLTGAQRSIGGTNGTSGARQYTVALSLTQPLFQGFSVRNAIREAEAAVRARRAELVNTEQNVLLDAVTAFYDIIQNIQIVELRQSDVRFLSEQVTAAQDRFQVGEGTRTDVSQAEAARAQAQTLLNTARANLASARARFRQFTGLDARQLRDNYMVERLLPKTVTDAQRIAQQGHPAIHAALHDVDVAHFNVKELEGQFLPQVGLSANANSVFEPSTNVDRADTASIALNVTVPIYQGGQVSAQVRQAKQQLGASRIQVDLVRDQIRQNVVAAFSVYTQSVRSIFNARTGVFAAQLALQGVIEEQRVGQRTTLDVLDTQSDLVAAQITLVTAERDRDVAAFTLLLTVGQLTAARLGLSVDFYTPEAHTSAVRDKWIGARTPDGR